MNDGGDVQSNLIWTLAMSISMSFISYHLYERTVELTVLMDSVFAGQL